MGMLQEVLKNAGLRVTPFREKVLEIFLATPHAAIKNVDLEEMLGKHDRITLYRTIRSFEEGQILHRVQDASNELKYALCHQDCNIHRQDVDHPHFLCSSCGTTYCLDTLGDLTLNLPENYSLDRVQVSISGTCDKCNLPK